MDDAERMVDDSPQTGKIIEAAEADDRMSLGSDADSVLRRGGPTLPADGSFNVSFPDQIALQEMRKRQAEMDIERGITQGDGWEQRDEFAHLVCTENFAFESLKAYSW